MARFPGIWSRGKYNRFEDGIGGGKQRREGVAVNGEKRGLYSGIKR
jgi:hypothetical protein